MEMNNGVRYVVNILISMISRGHIVGVSFKDKMETVFRLGLTVVVCCRQHRSLYFLLLNSRQKASISLYNAFIIGLAQACAVCRDHRIG